MIQEGNDVRFARVEFIVIKFNSDPFVTALARDFRSQNIQARAKGFLLINHIESFIRGLERKIEGRDRGHVMSEIPENAALYWGKVEFLLLNYKALHHQAILKKRTSDKDFVGLFAELYQTDAPAKAEIPAEPQVAAVA
ncbi:MAG: hypothetical protein QG607_404 [Patescibacteria group bacterium]|nr:hypothetical protein [Patescibacteria group bacterium]